MSKKFPLWTQALKNRQLGPLQLPMHFCSHSSVEILYFDRNVDWINSCLGSLADAQKFFVVQVTYCDMRMGNFRLEIQLYSA